MNIAHYTFLKKIASQPFVEAIWLFGSRARKDHEDRSDIDIAILCPKASNQDWQNIIKLAENADTLLKIDCVRFDTLKENDAFQENIIKFRKLLYTKEAGFMGKEFWEDYFKTLEDALMRLKEIISNPQSDSDIIYQEATIQRFEFSIELFWKVLKKFLAYEKISSSTPREVIQKAFQYSLIDDEAMWLCMLDDRNITSHLYTKDEAYQVYTRIKIYCEVMQKAYDKLKERFTKM